MGRGFEPSPRGVVEVSPKEYEGRSDPAILVPARAREAIDDGNLWVRLSELREPHLHVLGEESVLGLVVFVVRRKTITW